MAAVPQLLWKRFVDLEPIRVVRLTTAAAGVLAIVAAFPQDVSAAAPSLVVAGIAALICLAAAGLAATAARYLADVGPIRFPEALGLSRGARVIAWILATAAASMFLAWSGQTTILRVLHFSILLANAAVCYGLLKARLPEGEVLVGSFPVDFGVLSLLGSRPNVLGSVLDTAERQFGIDLRSTWALTVVRRWLEPLLGIMLVGLAFHVAHGRRVRGAGPRRTLGRSCAGPAIPAGTSFALAVAYRSRVSHSGQASPGTAGRPRR